MIDGPMGRGTPASGLAGLNRKAESSIGPFFVGEESRTRGNSDRRNRRGHNPSCTKIFHSALPDRLIRIFQSTGRPSRGSFASRRERCQI